MFGFVKKNVFYGNNIFQFQCIKCKFIKKCFDEQSRV